MVKGAGRTIRTYEADKGVGMSEAEAKRFLAESRSVIKLGTVDSSGEPNVHPVWYCFEPEGSVIYAFVGKPSRKAANIEKTRMVYFLVDQDRWPYIGVRGKGGARELTGGPEAMAIVEKILARYVKKDHPMFAQFLGNAKKGEYVVVEITPRYFSTWDYGKMPPSLLAAGL
ncbi:MAG: pyridoxamine 5'-phosphate oxidase family protein [Thaumarchaeota archaeon]|nr:pyridoxamine 5'-phosphate oxidase family protein [Nitrososphaerota archaeon]